MSSGPARIQLHLVHDLLSRSPWHTEQQLKTTLALQLFTQRQKGQLDVYGLWGVLRGQLLTDDSFVFNKVLNRIKESIQHLPDATEEDEEALLRVKVSAGLV